MKKYINTGSKVIPLFALGVFLFLWQLAVVRTGTPSWLMPAPTQVAAALADIFPLLWEHTVTTVFEALTGFVASIALAFFMAFLMDNVVWVRQALYPLIIISQTIPLIVLTVLFIIWFGFGTLPKVLVVILVCFFPILISLMEGMDDVDPDQIQLFRSMGANRLAIYKMVKLPASMPAFFSGLRISATYSIMAAIIGEWMGAESGLGYFMTLASKGFKTDQVLAAVLLICLLSLLLVKFIDLLEYLLLPWNRTDKTAW